MTAMMDSGTRGSFDIQLFSYSDVLFGCIIKITNIASNKKKSYYVEKGIYERIINQETKTQMEVTSVNNMVGEVGVFVERMILTIWDTNN